MRKFILSFVFFFGTLSAFGQEQSSIVTSKLPEDARFEIVRSPWDRNTMFRLDRFRGMIDRLGTCAKDDSVGSNKCWKEMIVLDLSRANLANRAKFQIIFDFPQQNIFLLQTDTGQTWAYALDATEKWHPFVDCSDKTNSQCLWRPLP